jgi:hypothetical protein
VVRLARTSFDLQQTILTPYEIMKIRFLLALVGLAISFALPAFAQEKETVDPEVRQQIEAVIVRFDEAFNRHDAAAIAALYTQDAVEMNSAYTSPAAYRGNAAAVVRSGVFTAAIERVYHHERYQK